MLPQSLGVSRTPSQTLLSQKFTVSTEPGALKSLLDWTGNSQQHASLFSLRGIAGMRKASSTWCGLTPSCDAPGPAAAKEAEEYTDEEGDDEHDALPHDCRPGLPA